MAMLVTLVFPLVILASQQYRRSRDLARQHLESWSSRAQRDYLRIHLTGRQQRFGICWTDDKHAWYNTAGAITMLVGRFFMIIPMLRSPEIWRQEVCPTIIRDSSSDYAVIHGALDRRDPDCGALTFFPALSLGPILEHLLMAAGKTSKDSTMAIRKKAVWEWKIVRRAIWGAFLKLNPRKMMGNPVMFVVEIGSVITTVTALQGRRRIPVDLGRRIRSHRLSPRLAQRIRRALRALCHRLSKNLRIPP